VELFGCEFYGQDPRTRDWKWVDHWDSTNSLPTLVHVGLGLGKTGKRGEPQDVVHRYIAVPATAVQYDWQVPGAGAVGVPRNPLNPNQSGNPNSNPQFPNTRNPQVPGPKPLR
jgi:hypothetical protein